MNIFFFILNYFAGFIEGEFIDIEEFNDAYGLGIEKNWGVVTDPPYIAALFDPERPIIEEEEEDDGAICCCCCCCVLAVA